MDRAFWYYDRMQYCVDINCDMGESFGSYRLGADEEILKYITSSNIACGFHASDPDVMAKTVELCREHGVMIGAHPGYPDLLGFGRRFMDLNEKEIVNSVIYQVGALKGFLDFFGVSLQHVKAHGALYNYLVTREYLCVAIASAIQRAFGDVILLVLGTKSTAKLKATCRQEGIRLALEAFPDRNYTDEGELLPRKHEGAVVKDPATIAKRAAGIVKDRGLESINGKWVELAVDTLCIHGDNPAGREAARMIRDYVSMEGIEIQPLHTIV
ncbi:MAG: LamB/YcsF family protein [Syntrophorhabdus sp. PtaU1.Bin002]|nr:MAG: LamB/YcsF family protein [Syntrophorhabdus sp. PtaB.Bin006]OPY71455.1 MAG: LamB/YcsF family protein [Syntrophorhabdus sp. PtaU1.Bin002]